MPSSPWLALLLALLPGLHAWLGARQLVARVQDPTFPELLLRRAQRSLVVLSVCLSLLLVLATRHVWWAAPLLALGLAAAAWPVRRGVWGETWSLAAYLAWTVRAALGQGGYWALLFLAPTVVHLARPWHWPAAVALLLLLVAWARLYIPLWLRLTGASPLPPEERPASFAPVLAGTTAGDLALHRLRLPGAVHALALALPDRRGHGVLFGQAVLDGLDDDELAAILAHEAAHLEAFDAAALRRLRLRNLVLVLGATLVAAVAVELAPESWAWRVAWPLVAIAVVARRAGRRQAEERRCDARAAALLGPGGAATMARALVRLHALAQLPRRWPHEFERQASHPSLARRLQALAALDAAESGATTSAAAVEPVLLRTTTPGRVVLLDDAGVVVADGVRGEPAPERAALLAAAASLRVSRYEELGELCLLARGGGTVLRATDAEGDAWSETIAAASLADAQRALDRVDARLGPPPPAGPVVPPRLVAAVLLLTATLSPATLAAAALPLVVALAAPRRALILAGLLLTALGALVPVLADPSSVREPRVALVLAATALVAAASLFLVRGRWPSRARWPEWTAGALLAALGVAAGAVVLWLTRGEPAAAAVHGGALLVALATVGVGALLLGVERAPARAAGAVALLAGLSLGALHAVTDRTAGPDAWSDAPVVATARVAVPGQARSLRASPSLDVYAVELRAGDEYDDADPWEPRRFAVGRLDAPDSPPRALQAHDLAFASEDELVTVVADTGGVELRLGAVSRDEVAWTRRLPAVYDPRLRVDAASRRWAILGYEPEGDGIVRYGGTLGDTAVRAERWPLAPSGLAVLFADAPPMIVAPRRPPARGVLGSFVTMTLHRWEGWRPDAAAPTWIGGFPGVPMCGDVPSASVAVCRVFERTGSSLWRVAPAEGPAGVAAIGWVPSADHPHHDLLDATLLPDGRVLVVTATGFDLVDPSAPRGRRLRVAGGTGGPRGVAATAAGIVLLAEHDGVVEVRRYAGRW